MNQDELFWERMVLRFRDYRRSWQAQGVLPMLRRLLADFELPARLLRHADGERSLTNLLHLAEWLQRAAVELDGEHALIRHLAEQVQSPGSEEILRLESDADLIKVVTIHKSRGWNTPWCCCPSSAAGGSWTATAARRQVSTRMALQGGSSSWRGARSRLRGPTSRPTTSASAKTCACSTWP